MYRHGTNADVGAIVIKAPQQPTLDSFPPSWNFHSSALPTAPRRGAVSRSSCHINTPPNPPASTHCQVHVAFSLATDGADLLLPSRCCHAFGFVKTCICWLLESVVTGQETILGRKLKGKKSHTKNTGLIYK